MLEPIRHILNAKPVVLASASPRRREILERNLGIKPRIVPSTFAENLDKKLFASSIDYAVENARIKAIEVAKAIKNDEWLVVIGADTIVELDKVIYEKPADHADAFRMIKTLSNRTHRVCTGVTLIKKKFPEWNSQLDDLDNLDVHSFSDSTEVTMGDLEDQVIAAYVATGEPMDKAGSYGIQDLGSSLVKSLNGDYFNVEGFPVFKFGVEFRKFLQAEK